jgi:hypothetical protein
MPNIQIQRPLTDQQFRSTQQYNERAQPMERARPSNVEQSTYEFTHSQTQLQIQQNENHIFKAQIYPQISKQIEQYNKHQHHNQHQTSEQQPEGNEMTKQQKGNRTYIHINYTNKNITSFIENVCTVISIDRMYISITKIHSPTINECIYS